MIAEEQRSGLKKLGLIYKKARMDAHLTQTEVATKARIHPSYYSRIERGEANLSWIILCRIFKALDLEVPDPFDLF